VVVWPCFLAQGADDEAIARCLSVRSQIVWTGHGAAADLWLSHQLDGVREGVAMSNKSPQKGNVKKQGKTLKEKRAAKKLKHADKPPLIPPTGH
jgi:hypothetical protein